VIGVGMAFCLMLAAAIAPGFARPLDDPAMPALLDDPLVPLTPKRPRSEAEQDRIHALALYAHGRVLLQREDFAAALRRYERAWRYDPDTVSILTEIVPLAFKLGHNEEAARYAVIAAESDPEDPEFLERLGRHLAEQREWIRALKFYENAQQLRAGEPPSVALLRLNLELGRLYFLTENFEKSAVAFAVVRDALEQPDRYNLDAALQTALLGQANVTYTLLGESFFQADRLDDAAAMFRKADEAKPNKGILALQLARIEAKRDRPEAALKHLDDCFQAKLSDAGTDPYELLAEVLKKQSSSQQQAQGELQKRLEEMYKADASNVPLGYYLATVYRQANQFDKAEKTYSAVLAIQPTLDAYQGLIDLYLVQGQKEKLLETLGKAISKTGSLEALGEAAKRVAADDELVKDLIGLARTKQKDGPQSLAEGVPLAIALLAVQAKEFDDADDFFELAVSNQAASKADIMSTWGLEMFMQEQFSRAAKIFQRIIDEKIAPDNQQAYYFYLANALEFDGRTEQAIAAAEKAASLDPKSPRFRSRVAWILYHAERHEEAEKQYTEVLNAFDSDHTSSEVRETMREARLILSNIAVSQDDLPKAEEWLEQVLDEFPEDVGALNDLGYLWADQNKHLQRALEMTRRAVDAEPDNIAYRDSLGWALYRLGRYEEAVKELEKATSGEDPDAVILDHLGDAYLKLGDREKAISVWQQAVKNLQESKDPKKLAEIEAKLEKHSAP
jgi:tetratricopeptide (TPR) repeat protein